MLFYFFSLACSKSTIETNYREMPVGVALIILDFK